MRFFYNFLLSFPLLIGCRDFDNKITAKLHNASVEVITDSVFTKGIEGPAMNSKGDLFVVNFKSEGTIGVLERDSISFKTFINLNKGSVGNGIRFDSNSLIGVYVTTQFGPVVATYRPSLPLTRPSFRLGDLELCWDDH